MKLNWNVYIRNFNERKIEAYNVFQHSYFCKEVLEACEEYKNCNIKREEFEEVIRRACMYYYWCKCEWETVITSWPPYITKQEIERLGAELSKDYPCLSTNLETGIKVDVYAQLTLNWEHFIDYLIRCAEEGDIC